MVSFELLLFENTPHKMHKRTNNVEMHCNIDITGKPNSSDYPKYWVDPTSLGI